jgi:hypothetical protein
MKQWRFILKSLKDLPLGQDNLVTSPFLTLPKQMKKVILAGFLFLMHHLKKMSWLQPICGILLSKEV